MLCKRSLRQWCRTRSGREQGGTSAIPRATSAERTIAKYQESILNTFLENPICPDSEGINLHSLVLEMSLNIVAVYDGGLESTIFISVYVPSQPLIHAVLGFSSSLICAQCSMIREM
jgi:hypothetical protein